MARRFSSFDEAWTDFLARDEPFESFYEALPEHESATLLVWLVPLDPALVDATRRLQAVLSDFEWLVPVPAHFLHITLAESAGARQEHADRLRSLTPFSVSLARLTCFLDAVVVEAEGDGLHHAAQALRPTLELFLPHLSIAYARAAGASGPLRQTLLPHRDAVLGEQVVRQVLLCEVPASRTTILQPWTVVERVQLG